MSGAQETDGLTVCSGCILSPIPTHEEEIGEDSEVADYDLSYLNDTVKKHTDLLKGRKSVHLVQSSLSQLAKKQSPPTLEIPVKKLKVKSNSIRDKAYMVESLVLHFDGKGVAEFPESDLEAVQRHMVLRPGRFQLVVDAPVEPKKDPEMALKEARAALEAAKAEPKEEPKVEKPKVEKPKAAKKPAVKKVTKKAAKKPSVKKSEDS